MTYIEIPGEWIRSAILESKPKTVKKRTFLARVGKALENVARLDGGLVKKILHTEEPLPPLPLFALAAIASEVGKSVEYLLNGSDDVADPALLSPYEENEIRSATNFAAFLRRFDVPFPLVPWNHAFPAQRRGSAGIITIKQWEAIFEESTGQAPRGRDDQ